LDVLRRSGDRVMLLRGLVFYAHSLADMRDLEGTEAVLAEADALAGGDPLWELAAIHADCAEIRHDYLRGLELYAESLSWSRTTGEAHQMLMDLRAIGPNMVALDHPEEALEVAEIVRLEEQRTGRMGDQAAWSAWIRGSIAAARDRVDTEAAERARVRARAVAETERAEHVIDLANRVVSEVRAA
jgi:hypothetical protein